MTGMRYPYLEFERAKITQIAKRDYVLDIGGGERFQKWLTEYRHLFKESAYKTFDYDASTSPDVVGDIHRMPLTTDSVDAIICYSVLEHVQDPGQALREIHRVLKPGGELLFYVPSIYPYHARKGHYPDYWRFFDDTLEFMFKDWGTYEIQKVGGYFKALGFFVPMQHKLRWLIDPTAQFLDSFFKTDQRTTTSGYIVYAKK